MRRLICILMMIALLTGAGFATSQAVQKAPQKQKAVICIDPGHQAKADMQTEPLASGSKIRKPKCQGGATGVVTKMPESLVNLQIAMKLKTLLEERGYRVVMTREIQKISISNSARADIANQCGAALFVRIHCDGSSNGKIHGISVLYPSATYVGKTLSDAGKAASKNVLQDTVQSTGAVSRGIVARDDMSGFNYCHVPSFLIECGFMSNVSEDKKLSEPGYQGLLAKGLADAVDAVVANGK